MCIHICVLGVYVPIGGKKLVTFMDDFNMPAKDTFGSQPPLELIRQWIDYGFWYDRQKQIVKQVKVKREIKNSCSDIKCCVMYFNRECIWLPQWVPLVVDGW